MFLTIAARPPQGTWGGARQASGTWEAGATRADVIGTILIVLIAATCVRLGIWQLDRLEQRDRLNTAIEARMSLPPLRLVRIPPDTTGLTYRRAILHGRCDRAHPLVLAGRSRRGAPGAELMCPFLPDAGGPAVLLHRGWAAAADARSVQPELLVANELGDSVAVLLMPFPAASHERSDGAERSGAIREPEPATVYRLNHDAVSGALPHPIAKLYGRRLPSAGGPLAAPGPLDLSRGPHLGYAVQWFSFAGIALLGWGALVYRRIRTPEEEPDHAVA